MLWDDVTVQVTLFSTLYFLLRPWRFLIVFNFFGTVCRTGPY